MTQTTEPEVAVMHVLDKVIEGATVRTVFGEPITQNGVSVVPVAKVRGGGGGGGGSGTTPTPGGKSADAKAPEAHGSGTGGGLALTAEPVGVFVIKGDSVAWRPAVDVGRLILGGQIVAVIALLTLRSFFRWSRRRR